MPPRYAAAGRDTPGFAANAAGRGVFPRHMSPGKQIFSVCCTMQQPLIVWSVDLHAATHVKVGVLKSRGHPMPPGYAAASRDTPGFAAGAAGRGVF
jgi:hypothetical protein